MTQTMNKRGIRVISMAIILMMVLTVIGQFLMPQTAFGVQKLLTSFTLTETSKTISVGETFRIIACTFKPVEPNVQTNKDLTWTSDKPNVATGTESRFSGMPVYDVIGKAPGTAKITATAKDGSGVSRTCTVTVTAAPPANPVTSLTLNKKTLKVRVGEQTSGSTLIASVGPSTAANKQVAWESSNKTVAAVNPMNGSFGVPYAGIIGIAPGTATITAKAIDGSGKSDTCTVTVIQPVTKVTLNKTSTTLQVGKTEQLSATVSPSNATNKTLTWATSGNTSVATVSASGVVTAKVPGTVTITAITTDGSGVVSPSCTVTVTNPPPQPPAPSKPNIIVFPGSGDFYGAFYPITGSGFKPNTRVTIKLTDGNNSASSGIFYTNSDGNGNIKYTVGPVSVVNLVPSNVFGYRYLIFDATDGYADSNRVTRTYDPYSLSP